MSGAKKKPDKPVTELELPNGKKISVYCKFGSLVPVDSLTPHPKNPNKHPERQLQMFEKVLVSNGWRAPITQSARSGFIVRGHGRWLAARRMGLAKVPVDVQPYESDDAEIADLLADNQVPKLAKIDRSLERVAIEALPATKIDLERTGFSLDEISEMLASKVEENVQMPIVPKIGEKMDYVLIFVQTETDAVFLRQLCGVKTMASYKNSRVGLARAVEFRTFLESLRENYNSVVSAIKADPDAQATE